jgi:hypothetical protein
MTSLSKLESFVKRVQEEMSRKKKKPADIARTGIVTDAAVSKMLSLKQKSVGYKMMMAVSEGLEVPLEEVKEWAGYKPKSKSVSNELTRRANEIMQNYKHESTRRAALSYLEHLRAEEKNNGT